MGKPELELSEFEMEIGAKLIAEEAKKIRPEFIAMSDEDLRQIINSESESDIRRVTAKLEGLTRHGFGPNDKFH